MRGPNHNFVVIAPMIMKFGTGIKLDGFCNILHNGYENVRDVTVRNYDVISCTLADV